MCVSPPTAEQLAREACENEIDILDKPIGVQDQYIAAYGGLRCFLSVDSPDLYEVFANHPFFDTNTERYTIRLFNRRETIARNVFRHCAPDLYYRPCDASQPPLHILVVGFEALVRELILQVALTAHYPDFRLARITVMVPPDRTDLVERFQHRYPHLGRTADVRFVYADALTVKPEQWLELQAEVPFNVCYVAVTRDVEGILARAG